MNAMVTQTTRYASGLLPHRLTDMSDQQYGRRAVEVGPTGKTVADNLARLRKIRGYSTRQLAIALEGKGRSISPSGITRMEKGDRVVTADDLTAFAAVFGVSPSALLLPLTPRPDTPIEVTGGGTVAADDAWAWANGQRPLHYTEGLEQTQQMEHQLYGQPQWLREPRGLILRGERSADELKQARQKYEFLASIGGASLDRLRELDPEAFEGAE